MKRIVPLLLAAALLIGCLTACAGDPARAAQDAFNDALDDVTDDVGGAPDLNALLSGQGNPDIDSLSEAEKATLVAEAAKEGVDLSFGADGSMTVRDADGSVTTYDGKGNWTHEDADGGAAQLGGSWPDNELSRLLPKPDLTVAASVSDEESCTVSFAGATLEQVKAYAARVKAAGYEPTEENEMSGVYHLVAVKGDYEVTVFFTGGAASVSIAYAPEDEDD